jgi:hypothetical protein
MVRVPTHFARGRHGSMHAATQVALRLILRVPQHVGNFAMLAAVCNTFVDTASSRSTDCKKMPR